MDSKKVKEKAQMILLEVVIEYVYELKSNFKKANYNKSLNVLNLTAKDEKSYNLFIKEKNGYPLVACSEFDNELMFEGCREFEFVDSLNLDNINEVNIRTAVVNALIDLFNKSLGAIA